MSGSDVAILAVSTLSLVTSAATLAVVLVGGKQMKQEVDETKEKANSSIRKLKTALEDLEL